MPRNYRSVRRARELRDTPTDAEQRLWSVLRQGQLGYKFRRQYAIDPYIVDFVCIERRLLIEVDGAHHAEQAHYDARRDRMLTARGFRVLRFTDREVLLETEGVRERIREALE